MLFLLIMIVYLVVYAGFVLLRADRRTSAGSARDTKARSGSTPTHTPVLPLVPDPIGDPVWTALDEHQLTRLLRQSAP